MAQISHTVNNIKVAKCYLYAKYIIIEYNTSSCGGYSWMQNIGNHGVSTLARKNENRERKSRCR